MKQGTTAADGATPENECVAGEPGSRPEEAKAASGTVSAFQEKMDRWTDRGGYGANRGLVCGLFTAWGLAVVSWIFKIAEAVLTHSYGKHDTDTLGESLIGLLVLTFGPSAGRSGRRSFPGGSGDYPK